jgi:hypothetical protein
VDDRLVLRLSKLRIIDYGVTFGLFVVIYFTHTQYLYVL